MAHHQQPALHQRRSRYPLLKLISALSLLVGSVPNVAIAQVPSAASKNQQVEDRGSPFRDPQPHPKAEDNADTISIQILSTNDFHGRLNQQRVNNAPAGGAAWLAAYLKRAEATNPTATLILDAGDMVGATPLESQAFQDRPTIDVANAIGYDNVTFGNHEFDAGKERLAEQTQWADYAYWSANVIDQSTGRPFLHPAPYEIFKLKGLEVGVINLTTESTPTIVNPKGIEGLSFTSTVETANAAVAELKRQNVRTIIIVGHLGTDRCLQGCVGDTLRTSPTNIAQNEAAKLAREVDDEVDLIIGGHTHQGVNTIIDGKRVVEAYSYGTAYADVDLTVSRATKNVVSSTAEIVTTWHLLRDGQPAVTPDPVVQAIVDEANAKVAPIRNEVVGRATVDLTRRQVPERTATSPGGESNLGDVTADAMNWRADQLENAAVDFAFTNAGGIRADIPKGDITRGQVIEAFPFQNTLAAVTLTGTQVKEVLEQGASGQHGMIQVSGLRFTYDPSRPVGDRVTSMTVAASGQPLDLGANYRLVTNDFMFNGGDRYTTFAQGANPVIYSNDLLADVLVAYLKANSPITQQIEGRITSP